MRGIQDIGSINVAYKEMLNPICEAEHNIKIKQVHVGSSATPLK